QSETAHGSAAQFMMGGDPSKEFTPGPNIIKPAAPGRPPARAKPAMPSGFEGLITLDPVCETVELPTRPFPPGNPAPSTRRMAKRLAEIRTEANPVSATYMSDRLVDRLQRQMT